MFTKVRCTIPQSAELQTNKANNQFIQTVLEEDRRVKDLGSQELQLTAENPRIRDQNETTDISEELRAQKHEEVLQQKRRQQLRENNVQIRQLQIQMRAAYVSKQLAEQKKDRDNLKQEQLRNKRQEDINFEKERKRTEEAFLEQEIKERQKKTVFRGVLQGQMAEANERRKKEYEDVLRDRDDMEKLLVRFRNEHVKELEELEQRKQNAKLEMEEFVKSQQFFKQQQRTKKMDENELYLQVMRERDELAQRIKDRRRLEHERRELLSNKIGQQLFVIEEEKKRRENLLLDLLVEERNTKEDERFRQNIEKQVQDRVQMRNELERYRMETLRNKEERQKNEDDLFRAEQMRILAEQDKLDQLSDERRRQKLREHGRAIQEMIKEKRLLRAIEAADKIRYYEAQRNEERKLDQMVEDERLRILSSAPPEVLRYLPAGVIRESDREFLPLPPNKEKN